MDTRVYYIKDLLSFIERKLEVTIKDDIFLIELEFDYLKIVERSIMDLSERIVKTIVKERLELFGIDSKSYRIRAKWINLPLDYEYNKKTSWRSNVRLLQTNQ